MSDPFNPYIAQHANTTGPGDARPTALDIVRDNGLLGGNPWAGRVCLVTGGTAGIGVETARALHATGADVYITARDAAKGQAVVEDIRASNGAPEIASKGKLDVIMMDLDSLASVKKAAAEFLGKSKTLNVLVNNAGIMAAPYTLTADGWERQFAVNHLAHLALTTLLLPALRAGSLASPGFASRVVQVASSGHRFSTVNLDDVNYTRPDNTYERFAAYGQSKTAMLWTANYVDRVYGHPKDPEVVGAVHANTVHPGGIWSNLMAHVTDEEMTAWKADKTVATQMKSPAQGAATTVWAAVGKVWEGKGGQYLAECARSGLSTGDRYNAFDRGHAPYAFEPESEERLWKMSLKMAGVDEP